jgi:signal transduction histidine kinase
MSLRILLISGRDALEEAIRSLLRLAIGEEADLTSVDSVAEAAQTFADETFDIILLEADDGEAVNQVQSLRDLFTRESLVVLTETSNHELGLACIRAGAHDYITLEEISPSFLFRTLRYVVERRSAQEALETSRSQLSQAQKMEAIGRMASGLAHDFRQYIQVIVGNAKILKRRVRGDEENSRLMDEVAAAGFGANDLVSQVLDFAREAPASRKQLELNGTLQNSRSMVESFGKKIHIEWDLHPQGLLIEADPVQLGQVVMNLAINAVDACQEGDVVQIRTRRLMLGRRYADRRITLESGHYAVIDVRDTGSGIPEEVGEKLFDPFFTTKPRGKGTGLGLSTVYSIVRGQGGQVAFWTKLGHGTSFSVFLPCTDQITARMAQPARRPVGLLSLPAPERNMLRHDLERLRCPVREFDDHSAALEWLEREPEGRVLVDHAVVDDLSQLNSRFTLMTGLYLADHAHGFLVLDKPFNLEALARSCR